MRFPRPEILDCEPVGLTRPNPVGPTQTPELCDKGTISTFLAPQSGRNPTTLARVGAIRCSSCLQPHNALESRRNALSHRAVLKRVWGTGGNGIWASQRWFDLYAGFPRHESFFEGLHVQAERLSRARAKQKRSIIYFRPI